MKTLNFKTLGLLIPLLAISLPCLSQGYETFDNLNAAGNTYTSIETSYNGDNDIVWYHRGTRSIGSGTQYEITGITCGLGGEGNAGYPGYIAATITGGIGEFSFTWRSYFTAGDENDRSLELIINGDVIKEFLLPSMEEIHTENITLDKPGNVFVKIRTSGTKQVAVDDIEWTGYTTDDPLLMVNPLSLTGFEYVRDNGPSHSQSYKLSGNNLEPANGEITITSPGSFEISTDNTNFTSSITVNYSNGDLDDVPVYVRLAEDLIAGGYESNIKHEGGNAGKVYINCQGTVNPPPPTLSFDGYTEDFSDFINAVTLPAGWSLDYHYDYEGDFGSGSAGGLRGNNALGFQLTSSAPNNSFEAKLKMENKTGQTIKSIDIEYTGIVRREHMEGTPKWSVYVEGNKISELGYSTESGEDQTIRHTINNLQIDDNQDAIFEWHTTSEGTSGIRRQIGITDVNITPVSLDHVDNPGYFILTPVDSSKIRLSWKLNKNNNDIVIVWNTSDNFSNIPYTTIPGEETGNEATVLYYGNDTVFNHTDLNPGTDYYYKIWSYDSEKDAFSNGLVRNSTTEPGSDYNIISGIIDPDPLSVTTGIPFDSLELPGHVTVQLDNMNSTDLPVIWDKGNYESSEPATYTIKGNVILPQGIVNPGNLKAKVIVEVRPETILYTVDFYINMSDATRFDPDMDNVYIRGDMNQWTIPGTQPGHQMMEQSSDNPLIYTKTFQLEEGMYEYRYYINDGLDRPENKENRNVNVDGNISVNDSWTPTKASLTSKATTKIYPNPARDIVYISSDHLIKYIELIDIHGRLISKKEINDNSFKFKPPVIPGKLIFIKIKTCQNVLTGKIVVNN